jgi:myo-inositol-1(or 4)-monophosphatase
MNYQTICLQVVGIAKEIGKTIKNKQKTIDESQVEIKGLHDFVTHVDKDAQCFIIEKLKELMPHSTFYAEEDQSENSILSDLTWIVDPLDGTTNYIHKIPLFTVSIALLHNNQLVVGVVYEPNLDECFYAWEGGGAWLNNKQIGVTNTKKLENSLLATGFPYYDYQHIDAFMEFLKFTILKTRGLRRLGSAALDLAWVACGRLDGFYEYGLRAWDVAAGACIVKEAGGKVSDFKNLKKFLFGKEVVASNNKIHNELCLQIDNFFFKGKKN